MSGKFIAWISHLIKINALNSKLQQQSKPKESRDGNNKIKSRKQWSSKYQVDLKVHSEFSRWSRGQLPNELIGQPNRKTLKLIKKQTNT